MAKVYKFHVVENGYTGDNDVREFGYDEYVLAVSLRKAWQYIRGEYWPNSEWKILPNDFSKALYLENRETGDVVTITNEPKCEIYIAVTNENLLMLDLNQALKLRYPGLYYEDQYKEVARG